MKLFTCSVCQQLLFFENVRCTRCDHALAYLPGYRIVSALELVEGSPGLFTALAPAAREARFRLCANYTEHQACNWAIPEESDATLCFACSFNEVIPNLSDATAKSAWQRIEIAKHRLLYTLVQLGLPLAPRVTPPEGEAADETKPGLGFAFQQQLPEGSPVYTGHASGLITLNIAEADDPYREQTRLEMGEAYRTLLGHFRHEVGHYYWDRLVKHTRWLEPFRARFGDETRDYQEAMAQHYERGAPADWGVHFVSAYASMHPWEDWAETWAHYLHMVDTLETARSYGLALRPAPVGGAQVVPVAARALHFDDFDDLVTAWFSLSIAMNSLNRSMGQPDLYPFVLPTEAIEKLRFVHEVIEDAGSGSG